MGRSYRSLESRISDESGKFALLVAVQSYYDSDDSNIVSYCDIPLDLINVEGVKTIGLYFNIQNGAFADLQMVSVNSLLDLGDLSRSLISMRTWLMQCLSMSFMKLE